MESKTLITFVIDKSGSMSGLEEQTVAGFNKFVEDQKKNSKDDKSTSVTTIFFDDDSIVVHDKVDLYSLKPLKMKDYVPSGCTALLDALGKAIELNNGNKDCKHIIVTITDGMENASAEYTYRNISSKIKTLTSKEGYEFIFMGANIDAIYEASRIGIDASHAVRYENDPEGVALNYETLGKAVASIKMCGSIDGSWKKDIEKRKKK